MWQRWWRDERGIAATIVLFPLFAVAAFSAVQAISWQHDRQLAAAAADRASSAIALYDTDAGRAVGEAESRLERAGMRNVTVTVTRTEDLTIVEISGDAPGILIGTSVRVHARSVTPTEGFDQP
jgi:hypothetical protein